jgi:hypothetical protein
MARIFKGIMLFCFCVLFTIGAFSVILRGVTYYQESTRVTEPWVKERMKYHGVQVCYEERGVHYFIRNGERIRL